MNKNIILLTKSKKYHNYCVAGIDIETGEWIRLISENDDIHNAVPLEDLTYEDNTEAQVLDIINVELIDHRPSYYQLENCIYNSKYYWDKIGRATIDQVLKIQKPISDNFIFHNKEDRLNKCYIESIPLENRYSLILIQPQDACIKVERNPFKYYRLEYTACFKYKEIYYELKITDIQFTSKYSKKGLYPLNSKVAFVVSLADLFHNCHYKLVASIIKM